MRRSSSNGFFGFWEKPLLYLAALCVVFLFLTQAMLVKDQTRRYLSVVDRLEGESIVLGTPAAGGDQVTVTDHFPVANLLATQRQHKVFLVRMLIPARSSEVFVLVNGSRAGDFQKGELALTVYEGDYLEIDAQMLSVSGRFVLKVQEAGVVSPEDGLLLEGKGQVIPIGMVKFSR